MRLLILLAFAWLVACAPARAQQPMPTGDRFLGERIGSDALTIRDLLNKLATAEARAADLQAQLDKRGQGDTSATSNPKETP